MHARTFRRGCGQVLVVCKLPQFQAVVSGQHYFGYCILCQIHMHAGQHVDSIMLAIVLCQICVQAVESG